MLKNKNKIKIILYISIFFITLISFYAWYNNNSYYNNYYTHNSNQLNLIKNYIIDNQLEGYFYIEPINNREDKYIQYKGTLGTCFKENKCDYLLSIIKELNISKVSSFSYDSNDNFYGKGGTYIVFGFKNSIYGNKLNELYYSQGYFQNKIKMEKVNNSRYSRIIKIINNDWGVINLEFGMNYGVFG